MLAVVVVPLSLLVIACLMERLEARVAPTATVRLAPRRITAGVEESTPTDAGRRGHLRVLPTPDADDDEFLAEAS